MQIRQVLPLMLAIPLAITGCGGGDKPVAKGDQPVATDGLKELVKEDIVVGKPTKFNPKMKPVEDGDTVWVIYTGTFKDGKQFDSNDPKGNKDARPFSFQVGTGSVIKGWDQGLLGMYPGGERKLSVPWTLAYGEAGRDKIPPKADLYFDVKVLEVVKYNEDMTYGMFDEKVGSGPVAKKGSTVSVHCTVKEVGGNLLQDTRDPDSYGKPVTFTIGNHEALAAVDDGVVGMRQGGIRELAIPPRIGFPPSEQTGVQENSYFYVRVELLSVK